MMMPDRGPVMLDLVGQSLDAEERERLCHPATGGLILFRRNYENPRQLRALIAEARAQRPALLVAVDHEGGRVQRFREGFTRLPAAATYARQNDAELAEKAGWLMAAELRSVGIDFSFAPVLDVEQGISQVIGDRAFGTSADEVIRYAGAFMAGMKRAGMAAVGKHFPGHGGVVADSHLELPVDDRPLQALESSDLLPFRRLIKQGLAGIMPAHVIYTALDPQPAGFSSFWLQTLLRGTLGFCGAIFSDDLSMAGARWAGTPAERASRALAAGCDMVLVCNEPKAAAAVLDQIGTPEPDPAKGTRLALLEAHSNIDLDALRTDPDHAKLVDRLQSLATETA